MDIVHPMETQLKHKCDASGQKMSQTNPFQVASLLSSFAHFSSCWERSVWACVFAQVFWASNIGGFSNRSRIVAKCSILWTRQRSLLKNPAEEKMMSAQAFWFYTLMRALKHTRSVEGDEHVIVVAQ